MAEKKFKYTTKIAQPQTVCAVKLDPKGGEITEREYKAIKKDAYGASLLEKKLLVVDTPAAPPSAAPAASETVPDFDGASSGASASGTKRK